MFWTVLTVNYICITASVWATFRMGTWSFLAGPVESTPFSRHGACRIAGEHAGPSPSDSMNRRRAVLPAGAWGPRPFQRTRGDPGRRGLTAGHQSDATFAPAGPFQTFQGHWTPQWPLCLPRTCLNRGAGCESWSRAPLATVPATIRSQLAIAAEGIYGAWGGRQDVPRVGAVLFHAKHCTSGARRTFPISPSPQ